ncbi:MAG: MFS transporter [Candidatus Gastranaerophilales bacterium]|nr:MFS transporter [Candidatus Gastranaerophilales bacterium]
MSNFISKPNKKALAVLSAGHMVNDIYGGFIIPLMPVIAAKLNISLGIIGLILSISSFSSSVLQPLFGYISDILKRRFFIFTGMLLSAVLISLIGYSNNVFVLGLFVFFGSMGVGLFHPQATALAAYFSGREINNLMGFFIASGTIGFALGPFFSSFLVSNFGLKSTIFAVIPGIIIFLLMYKVLPKVPVRLETQNFSDLTSTIVNFFNKNLIILAFISMVRALSIMSFTVFMPFLWKEHNYSIFIIGVLIGLFSLFGGIASYIGGKLNNYTGEKIILFISLLPGVPCLFGTLYFLDKIPYLSFVLFIVSGFLLTFSTSVNIVIAQKTAPQNVGTVSGIIGGFCWGIAGLILTPIGFLSAKYGVVNVLAYIAFVPIFGAIALSFMNIEKRS